MMIEETITVFPCLFCLFENQLLLLPTSQFTLIQLLSIDVTNFTLETLVKP